jgi:hypothetical protein
MSVASNTHRPHIGGLTPSRSIARDAVPADRDEAIRNLIALAPEGDRAALEDLLLGDADGGQDGEPKPMVKHAQDTDAVVARLADLARAGRMTEFGALAFGLPNLGRIEPPAASARPAPVAQDAYARALASGARAAAADEVSALFPNMRRI